MHSDTFRLMMIDCHNSERIVDSDAAADSVVFSAVFLQSDGARLPDVDEHASADLATSRAQMKWRSTEEQELRALPSKLALL